MSILSLAESDLALTLESTSDFGKSVSLTDPSGTTAVLSGQYGDVSALLDLEEEMVTKSNVVHISLRLSSIASAGLEVPQTVQTNSKKPWRITVTGVDEISRTFKLTFTMPDRTLGLITAIIERLNVE